MRGAAKIHVIANQKFPAPDSAISSISGAVKRYTDHISVQTMLGHTTSHVSMMMLNRDPFHPLAFHRVLRRCVVGMQIVRNRRRPKRKKVLIELNISRSNAVNAWK